MAFCTQCGKALPTDSRFCPECGTAAAGAPMAAPTAEEAAMFFTAAAAAEAAPVSGSACAVQTAPAGQTDSAAKPARAAETGNYRVILAGRGTCPLSRVPSVLAETMRYDAFRSAQIINHMPAEIACGMPKDKARQLAAILSEQGLICRVVLPDGTEREAAHRGPGRGTQTSAANRGNISPKSRWGTFFLCLFLGCLGIHRFYTGRVGTGILWLLTFGVCGVGWLVDLILLASGTFKDSDGRVLKQ